MISTQPLVSFSSLEKNATPTGIVKCVSVCVTMNGQMNAFQLPRNEFLRAPEQQLLHEAPQIERGELHGGRDFADIIGAADRIVSILNQAVEGEQLGHPFPADREAGRRQRCGAHAAAVAVGVSRLQAADIPAERIRDGGRVVGHGRRLRLLRMRVADHHRVRMLGREAQQPVVEPQRRRDRFEQLLSQRQPVDRDAHVVAAAGQMQIARRLACVLQQLMLHLKKQILELPRICASPKLRQVDGFERGGDALRFLLADQPLLPKHQQMRLIDLKHRLQQLRLGLLIGGLKHDLGIRFARKAVSFRLQPFVLLNQPVRPLRQTSVNKKRHFPPSGRYVSPVVR